MPRLEDIAYAIVGNPDTKVIQQGNVLYYICNGIREQVHPNAFEVVLQSYSKQHFDHASQLERIQAHVKYLQNTRHQYEFSFWRTAHVNR